MPRRPKSTAKTPTEQDGAVSLLRGLLRSEGANPLAAQLLSSRSTGFWVDFPRFGRRWVTIQLEDQDFEERHRDSSRETMRAHRPKARRQHVKSPSPGAPTQAPWRPNIHDILPLEDAERDRAIDRLLEKYGTTVSFTDLARQIDPDLD